MHFTYYLVSFAAYLVQDIAPVRVQCAEKILRPDEHKVSK